jgi:hypothetical protein
MGKSSANSIDLLKANLKGGIKTYSVYDGSQRVTAMYETVIHWDVGAPALATFFAYDGTSSRLVGTKEEKSTWTATMEAALPATPALP